MEGHGEDAVPILILSHGNFIQFSIVERPSVPTMVRVIKPGESLKERVEVSCISEGLSRTRRLYLSLFDSDDTGRIGANATT